MEIKTPGRICLFGEHQDYLGLPVIALAISRHSKIIGFARSDAMIVINKPDLNEVEKFHINDNQYTSNFDLFKSGLNVCKHYGFKFSKGFDVVLSSNIPIKAGASSSSSILVGWINFLSNNAKNPKQLSSQKLARLAFEAEVLEFNAPGGMMDQYSTAIGGLIHLKTSPELSINKINHDLGAFVIGDSMNQKDTVGILSRCKNQRIAILNKIKNYSSDINFNSISENQVRKFKITDHEKALLIGTIKNRDILIKGRNELIKKHIDKHYLGQLMVEHHKILSKVLKVSTSKIDLMLKSALDAGAYGGKINGSGGGGCMFAYCPENPLKIKRAIEGVGGKAYVVQSSLGTTINNKGKHS
ncbi:MAG: mevalonate kinase [Candidatus Neomarinimicrobiota bacterium]